MITKFESFKLFTFSKISLNEKKYEKHIITIDEHQKMNLTIMI